jgi:murein DD-endopeptidase MepM/ murein hydrolase activator NlpD
MGELPGRMSSLRKTARTTSPLHRKIARNARGPVLADRELILRSGGRVVYVPLPRVAQIGALVVVGACALWLLLATYSFFSHDNAIAAREAEIDARENAVAELRDQLAHARRQFAEATDSLEKNHKGLVELIGQNQSLRNSIHALKEDLVRAESDRSRTEGEKAELAAKVEALEGDLRNSDERNRLLARELKTTGAKLADAMQDKSRAAERGQSLSGRVAELQDRLSTIRDSQSSLVGRVAESSQAEIRRLRGIIASTGIKLGPLLEAQGIPTMGTGGPFEAATQGERGQDEGENFELALNTAANILDHLDGLQRIVRGLPLAAPLDYYYVSSPYGVRSDPMNGEDAMHRGVDFGSKLRATVFATAPGTVVYAGWKGKFGRFVEIDHGNGVITRYGHLRRIMVKRGEQVDYRKPVGQMGNSGRSTGTHLHYEIHVNGQSIDPLKFLKAGKNVLKG